jgi:hypothetical protein
MNHLIFYYFQILNQIIYNLIFFQLNIFQLMYYSSNIEIFNNSSLNFLFKETTFNLIGYTKCIYIALYFKY